MCVEDTVLGPAMTLRITRVRTAGPFVPKVLTTSGGVSLSMNPQLLLLPLSLCSPGHHVPGHKRADWLRGPALQVINPFLM